MSNKRSDSNNTSAVLSTLPPIVPSLGSLPHHQEDPPPAQGEPLLTKKIPPTLKIGTRLIFTSGKPQRWSWKTFSSSARRDNVQFSHWVRDNLEYADYPYARFDVSLDKLEIMEEEYSLLGGGGEEVVEELVDVDGSGAGASKSTVSDRLPVKESSAESHKMPSWTREETETLMELAHKYELRWPVIIDRWHARFNVKDGKRNQWSVQRKVEDLQYRYYYVGNVLARKRLEGVVAQMNNGLTGTGTGTAAEKTGNLSAVTAAAAASSGEPTGNARPAPANYNNPPLDNAESTALQAISQNLAIHPTLTPNLTLSATGTTIRSKPFDLFAERARRTQLHHIWSRPKEEEKEEEELRAELRAVEGQLRKLKKSGRYLVKSHATSGNASGAVVPGEAKSSSFKQRKSTDSSAAPVAADVQSNTEQFLNASFQATAPVPTPGTPYLQSARLFPPACGGQGLNKSTLKQMDDILKELGVREPICTKRACDLYDGVRKDALTLLILKKVVLRKEAEVVAKKSKLVGVLGVGSTTSVVEESQKKEAEARMKTRPSQKLWLLLRLKLRPQQQLM
ncbi:hypothetical protein HJC23_004711 [Cyclotella cryptica]|uniref:dAMP1 SANT/Myb-like domain-containing protein n=1 Tax=Cyclotella cryptica TaxID=29204 RepID=A0ABD3PRQ9_9STRA|eukprot:CCRYP_012036-RB/>CCRYP_012036-RB protein AED:0.00 eAED:0.00 QI:237/-1/1/1/-1/1/1/764/565